MSRLFAIALCLSSLPGLAAQLVVDTGADGIDSNPGDGTCAGPVGCSLRAAVMEANALPGQDEILLSGTEVTLTLAGINEDDGLTGDLDVRDDVVIEATGARVDGAQIDRLFDVEADRFEIKGGVFTGGEARAEGGAVLALRAEVVIDGVTFVDNEAFGDGGAVHVSGGSLSMQNTRIEGNAGSFGGGVSAEQAAVTISTTDFVDNAARDGGALFLSSSRSVAVVSSRFESNGARLAGGAVFLSGATGNGDAFQLDQLTFIDNQAISGFGGGVFVNHLNDGFDETPLSLTGCRFERNLAAGGGGLWARSGSVSVADCVFDSNEAGDRDSVAGAIYVGEEASLSDVLLRGNVAQSAGAALYADGDVALTNVVAEANLLDDSDVGAGIYVVSENLALPDSDGDGINDGDDAFPNDPNEFVDTDGDGVGNEADTDDDGDGVRDEDDDFPLDPTRSMDIDSDGDGVSDARDAFPNDPTESADTDSDGVGNGADEDDDGDGTPDAEEERVGSDPLDASDGPDDHRPAQPVLFALTPDATNPLGALLIDGSPLDDPDEVGDPSRYVLEVLAPLSDGSTGVVYRGEVASISPLALPRALLTTGAGYQLAVGYIDSTGLASPLSDPIGFVAAEDPFDLDANGIADLAELAAGADLNGDGTDDRDEGFVVIADAETGAALALSSDQGELSAVSTLGSQAPELADLALAGELPFGLVGFVIDDLEVGASVVLSVRLGAEPSGDLRWLQWGPNAGLIDLTSVASVSGQTVQVTLTDGGLGDLDGVANGRIVDPSGLESTPQVMRDGGSDSRCFIATAAFGEHARQTHDLRSFRDSFLVDSYSGAWFVEWYYSHSPAWVAWSADKPVLRTSARLLLEPVAGFAALATGRVPLPTGALLVGVLLIAWAWRLRRPTLGPPGFAQ